MKASNTFEEAVQTFFDNAEWLSDDELPAMTSLMKSAQALDAGTGRMSATLLAEYGKVFRYLRNLKPEDEGTKKDEYDDLIDGLDEEE